MSIHVEWVGPQLSFTASPISFICALRVPSNCRQHGQRKHTKRSNKNRMSRNAAAGEAERQ